MPVILIAGGTGLIGSRLSDMLREKGHVVRILTRAPKGESQFAWNPAAGTIDEKALQGVDFVVNLAGAGIADKHWTPSRKRLIISSRVQSARTLRDAFLRTGIRPKACLSTSAIGYYGNSGERWMTETDAPVGKDFMTDCCRQWEDAVNEVAALGIRTVIFRTGIVLAKEGGALAEFVKPLRFGVGGYFADGRAWYSWIHLDDVCRMFLWAIENRQAEGVYNAVAPYPVRNKEFVKAIARAMRQPAVMAPGPAFVMRLVLGEMAAAILNSNRVSAEKILKAGFQFQYDRLDGALKAIF